MAKFAPLKPGYRPSHPGSFFREEVLMPLGVSVSAAASALGVRRATLSDLVNEKTSLTPDLYARINAAFGWYGGTLLLLRMQARLDEYQANQLAKTLRIKRYDPEAA